MTEPINIRDVSKEEAKKMIKQAAKEGNLHIINSEKDIDDFLKELDKKLDNKIGDNK